MDGWMDIGADLDCTSADVDDCAQQRMVILLVLNNISMHAHNGRHSAVSFVIFSLYRRR